MCRRAARPAARVSDVLPSLVVPKYTWPRSTLDFGHFFTPAAFRELSFISGIAQASCPGQIEPHLKSLPGKLGESLVVSFFKRIGVLMKLIYNERTVQGQYGFNNKVVSVFNPTIWHSSRTRFPIVNRPND